MHGEYVRAADYADRSAAIDASAHYIEDPPDNEDDAMQIDSQELPDAEALSTHGAEPGLLRAAVDRVLALGDGEAAPPPRSNRQNLPSGRGWVCKPTFEGPAINKAAPRASPDRHDRTKHRDDAH